MQRPPLGLNVPSLSYSEESQETNDVQGDNCHDVDVKRIFLLGYKKYV
ncbi:hypothetical protein GsuE55_27520 [Geobacillus subterraneus]|uniref:Uncharacterized protein n=1 Tax=Geobacillus subterraneus TaxID=129338 RepID=A0A679FS62_9BACL|nr:hypothetical protein GsuE55_27520 [Geobacillus subterraneus]